MSNEDLRIAALALHLDEDPDEIETADDDTLFYFAGQDFLVLTDDEADTRVTEYIEESLWAFRLEFLWDFFGEFDDSYAAVAAMKEVAEKLCESANPIFRALVGDRFPKLVQAAIAADGRGHFLNNWDGNEVEVWVEKNEARYIYRQ